MINDCMLEPAVEILHWAGNDSVHEEAGRKCASRTENKGYMMGYSIRFQLLFFQRGKLVQLLSASNSRSFCCTDALAYFAKLRQCETLISYFQLSSTPILYYGHSQSFQLSPLFVLTSQLPLHSPNMLLISSPSR